MSILYLFTCVFVQVPINDATNDMGDIKPTDSEDSLPLDDAPPDNNDVPTTEPYREEEQPQEPPQHQG